MVKGKSKTGIRILGFVLIFMGLLFMILSAGQDGESSAANNIPMTADILTNIHTDYQKSGCSIEVLTENDRTTANITLSNDDDAFTTYYFCGYVAADIIDGMQTNYPEAEIAVYNFTFINNGTAAFTAQYLKDDAETQAKFPVSDAETTYDTLSLADYRLLYYQSKFGQDAMIEVPEGKSYIIIRDETGIHVRSAGERFRIIHASSSLPYYEYAFNKDYYFDISDIKLKKVSSHYEITMTVTNTSGVRFDTLYIYADFIEDGVVTYQSFDYLSDVMPDNSYHVEIIGWCDSADDFRLTSFYVWKTGSVSNEGWYFDGE